MKHLNLSPTRRRKLKELLHEQCSVYTISKAGDVRYGTNILRYIFKPNYISLTAFCLTVLTGTYKVPYNADYPIDRIIDIAYSNFILGSYNLSAMGADYKFNTFRNVFRFGFRRRSAVINHYSDKLSVPVIKILRKELTEMEILNLLISERVPLSKMIRDVEHGIIDHVRKQFSLMRAGPEWSPIRLVA